MVFQIRILLLILKADFLFFTALIYLRIHFYSTIFNPNTLKGIFRVSRDEIMTVKELADYLKIAEKTAYRFASEGKVPGFKVGSAWRFKKAEIDAWIKRQSEDNIANKDTE